MEHPGTHAETGASKRSAPPTESGAQKSQKHWPEQVIFLPTNVLIKIDADSGGFECST